MPRDGIEIVARWRESGAWWEGEQPIEVARYRDSRGVLREKIRPLDPALPASAGREHQENSSDDISLRPRKVRDEKVAVACGWVEREERLLATQIIPVVRPVAGGCVALHLQTGYSFGRSVLFARDAPRMAANLGYAAAAIADRFALTGAVEFARECRSCGIKPLIGATIELDTGGEVVLIARDKSGYASLSQLITECHLGEPRLFPLCTWERLERYSRGLLCLTGGDGGMIDRLLLQRRYDEARENLERLVGLYGRANVFVEVERTFLPWQRSVNSALLDLAQNTGVTPVAGGLVTHGTREEFPAQDVLVCAETLCLVEEIIGRKPHRHPDQPPATLRPQRAINAERYLRPSQEWVRLYRDRPDLIENAARVAERCDDDVLPSRTRLPQIFDDPVATLRELTFGGATERHERVTPGLKRRLEHELGRICRLGFAGHFLTAWDICRWSRDQEILFSGRGSVVDSAVAHCLGFSRIDAWTHKLHFDRFLPEDGSKRPDIDIDFEAHRRDDVRNYVIRKYGADHVATVSAIGAFCTRGIVREVGKALGLPQETIGFLAKRIHGGVPPEELESALERRPELRDSNVSKEKFGWVFRLGKMLTDVPRNMRAHSSGVVISDQPLALTVPVQWSGGLQESEEGEEGLRIIQWDKRSAKHYFDKFDILCLRGQDVLSGTQSRVREHRAEFRVESIALDDEDTYRAMRAGQLVGIPQSASPAMRQAHMRLGTADLHDASLVQAGIRPGVGGAVKINELIARRKGLKPFTFEHPDLESILRHTYGIVVFQEQIDQLLQVFAGYGSGQAEEIREEIHKRRREDYGQVIKDEVLGRILARGYTPAIADHVFDLVAGFKGYGFAQGHALAFAEISIRSIYCQQNFPADYFASLLDAQPAGYYGPYTLVNEARNRGVAILPLDVNASRKEFSVEDVRSEMDPQIVLPRAGIRVAWTQLRGLSVPTRDRILAHRGDGYVSFFDFVRRVKPERDELDRMILAGAFDTLEPNRKALMWAGPSALAQARAQAGSLGIGEPEPMIDRSIPDYTPAEKAIRERAMLGMDIGTHLMAWEREKISARGGLTTQRARDLKPGRKAIVVGNPIRLRFPPTPSGKRVVFFDLEDETGLLNVTCFDAAYRRDGHAIVCSPYVTLIGVSQWRDGHTAFLAQRVFPYSPHITTLVDAEEPLPIGAADFLVG